MSNFQCLRVASDDLGMHKLQILSRPIAELVGGDTLIRAHYSSLNYKDALAVLGRGKILRSLPMTPGIDVSGEVVKSEDPRLPVGTHVLVTGCGLGETQDGGLAEYVRVPGDWVIPLPLGLSLREAMQLGTAGFTAALAIARLELNGIDPQRGPILVTGASGGVGSLAIDVMSQIGYSVIAVSSRRELSDYLLGLGAKQVIAPADLKLGDRPLEKARWAAAIDNVGGEMLAGLLRHIDLWGAVASVGLAGGSEFSATVMPFILRGVSLLGVSSTNCPHILRTDLWKKLGTEWKPRHLAQICHESVGLNEVEEVCERILNHQHYGRTLVKLI